MKKSQLQYFAAVNFSGRSEILRWESAVRNRENSRLYIGEIPSDYITGIAQDVLGELAFHRKENSNWLEEAAFPFMELTGFDRLMKSSPFELSGGEQAILVILSSLILGAEVLGIDSTIEQVGAEWRKPLFELFTKVEGNILLSDNRITEYIQEGLIGSEISGSTNRKTGFSVINQLDPNALTTKLCKPLILDNISYCYKKGCPILDKCSYKFEPSVIYHLEGRNGAGKSTLAKLLSGLTRQKSGKIFIGDNDKNIYKYPGKFVGYSYQNPDEQLFETTIQKQLGYRAEVNTLNKNLIFKSVADAFGLIEHLTCHPGDMPFTMRKRISLAATISNERDWYIFDEPTLGQDVRNSKYIAEIIQQLAKKGKGVIIISHSNEFISTFLSIRKIKLVNGTILT